MKIIILTAFDEFEYAKQCIGLGITDYLLKPIVRTDIQSACKKAIHELDSQPIRVRTIFSQRYAIQYGPHQTIYYGKLPRFILESYRHCTGIWL